MTYTYNAVKQFSDAFPPLKEMNKVEIAQLVTKLIAEESLELIEEIWQWAQTGKYSANLLKEDADLQYVLDFARIRIGLPDSVEAFTRTHLSNMSKLDENGKPIYREDGKVLKGPNYKPPVFDDLVDQLNKGGA